MSRVALLALVCLLVASLSTATGTASRGARRSHTVTGVTSMHLVAPGFGYVTGWRSVDVAGTYRGSRLVLGVFDRGHWRDATPSALRSGTGRDGFGVEDVAFSNRRDGWLATFNCAMAAVKLYRTRDGGRSWRSLGVKGGHSCSAPSTTYLSFVNARRGWMELTDPTGPGGSLSETRDGGKTWKLIADGVGRGAGHWLPCLAPIAFSSGATGWMGRCNWSPGIFSTTDGGRRWKPSAMRLPNGRFDLPWFAGRRGVEAATDTTGPPGQNARTRAVVFFVTENGGRSWQKRATRRIADCPIDPFFPDRWPASVAKARTWWVVAGRVHPIVQVTSDGGRSWSRVRAAGLPARRCSVVSVTAASATEAWVTARTSKESTALFRTIDGGRVWKQVRFF